MPKIKQSSGYTMIEILIVVSIIGFVVAAALYAINASRVRARDTRRLADMKQVQLALNVYYDQNGNFPSPDIGDGCGGWDAGNQTFQLLTNRLAGVMNNPPNDMTATDCNGYRYYRYSAGSYGCDVSKGAYYVLGVIDMENSGRPHPDSPGWSCSGRNWQNEFDWVVGKFENG